MNRRGRDLQWYHNQLSLQKLVNCNFMRIEFELFLHGIFVYVLLDISVGRFLLVFVCRQMFNIAIMELHEIMIFQLRKSILFWEKSTPGYCDCWILKYMSYKMKQKHVSLIKVNLLQTEKYMWSGCCNCEINKWLSLILVICRSQSSSIHYSKNI